MTARIVRVRERMAAACARAGRDPETVLLIGVTKTHGTATIAAAHAAGLRHFGENRVQEAAPKIERLRTAGMEATWHLVGHLQTNKIRAALGLFDILHGVDSERLGEAISAGATRPVRVLAQVNVAAEASKHGVPLAQADGLVRRLRELPNIDVIGLMTVAPQVDNPEEVRPVFQSLRALRDRLGLRELSMGMTDDFEVAIEEGATMVRVGRAIFGEREAATAR